MKNLKFNIQVVPNLFFCKGVSSEVSFEVKESMKKNLNSK